MSFRDEETKDFAEKAVVGACLIDDKTLDDVAKILKKDDFRNFALGEAFDALTKRNDSGVYDLIRFVDDVKKSGAFEDLGREAGIADIMESCPVASNGVYYARIVREESLRRRLSALCSKASSASGDKTVDVEKTLSDLSESVADLFVEGARKTERLLGDVALETTARIDSGEVPFCVPTGFDDLDYLLGGFRESELVVVAARPGMGKTSFAANVVEFASIERKIPTVFFSLEMTATELCERIVGGRVGLSVPAIRSGLTNDEKIDFAKEVEAIYDSPLYVDDSATKTANEIASSIKRLKREVGIKLAVVDYLGLVKPEDVRVPRQEQVASITRTLKQTAKTLRIPIVCLAQLNRENERSGDFRPRLSQLRESGAVEQDADAVLFVHREEYYMTRDEAEEKGVVGEAQIIVAKHRNGETGAARLRWNGETTRFYNVPRVPVDDPEYNAEFDSFDDKRLF